jgi:hypothetical protein
MTSNASRAATPRPDHCIVIPLPDAVDWGALAIGVTLGAMLFFSACVAPLTFMRLEPDVAGRLIRALFPWYHATALVGSSLAAVLCAGAAPVAASLSLAAALGFLLTRQVLVPAVHAARDAAMADAGAAQRFTRLHRASVAVNVVQFNLLLLAYVFATARS